jgi:hypothetical protein
MSDYIPDRWVIVKISGYKDRSKPVYKVFASWYGGWAGSDSWKLNSGITKATLEGFVYSFEGSSGSVYECHKDIYGTNMYGMSVLSNMIDKAAENGITIEILPEETNFLELNYE